MLRRRSRKMPWCRWLWITTAFRKLKAHASPRKSAFLHQGTVYMAARRPRYTPTMPICLHSAGCFTNQGCADVVTHPMYIENAPRSAAIVELRTRHGVPRAAKSSSRLLPNLRCLDARVREAGYAVATSEPGARCVVDVRAKFG